MKFNDLPEDLSNIQPGIYRMTETQYFSEALESVAFSQSVWKQIKKKSLRRILADRANDKKTKARRIGSGSHYLFVEDREAFEANTFIKKVFVALIGKTKFVEMELSEDNKIVVPEVSPITEYIEKEMEGVDDEPLDDVMPMKEFIDEEVKERRVIAPQKVPTVTAIKKDGGNKEAWEYLKKCYEKEKLKYDKELGAIKNEWTILKNHFEVEKEKRNQILVDIKRGHAKKMEMVKNAKEAIKKQKEEIVSRWQTMKDERDAEVAQYQKDFIEAENNGLVFLDDEEVAICEMINRACLKNKNIKRARENSHSEIVLIVRHEKSGLLLKSKLDLYNENDFELTDFKTADDIDPSEYFWSFRKWEIDIQLASYRWSAEKLGLKVRKVKIAAGSKKAEEAVLMPIPIEWIDSAWEEGDKRICKFAEELRLATEGIFRYDEEIELKDPREENDKEVLNDMEKAVDSYEENTKVS